MKLEVSVAGVIEVFKEIQEIKKQPGKILEMVKTAVPKVIENYWREIMQVELTPVLGQAALREGGSGSNEPS